MKQPKPDNSPEQEDFLLDTSESSYLEEISKLKTKIKQDQEVRITQLLDNLQQSSFQNAKIIGKLFDERKNLTKQYQKIKYREYKNEIETAIKMSIAESSRDPFNNNNDYAYEDLLSLQEKIGFVNVGLSTDEIDSIPVSASEFLNTCAICLNQGKIGKVLVCSHFFHKECIDKWLAEKKSCPLCLCEVNIR